MGQCLFELAMCSKNGIEVKKEKPCSVCSVLQPCRAGTNPTAMRGLESGVVKWIMGDLRDSLYVERSRERTKMNTGRCADEAIAAKKLHH